jgi:hypothetical protein
MGLVGENAVLVDREDHPREEHVIDEDSMPVVDAVSLVLSQRLIGSSARAHPSHRRRACSCGIPTHASAVAVPLDDRGVVDIGIERRLHAIPGGKQKRSRLFSPLRAIGGFGENRAGHVLDDTAAPAGGGSGFAGNLRRLRLGLRGA